MIVQIGRYGRNPVEVGSQDPSFNKMAMISPTSDIVTPPDIPTTDLVGWWKANSLSLSDLDLVSTVVDSAGNGWDLTQTNATYKPVYRTNVINGYPAIRFDTQFFDVPSLFSGVTEGEIFIIFQIDNDPPLLSANTGLYTLGGGNERGHFPWIDGTIYDNFMCTGRKTLVNPTPSLTSWRLYDAISISSEWTARLDGTQIYTTGTNTVTTTGNRFIGKSEYPTGGPFYLKGYIAEVIFYKAKVGTSDLASIKTYLANKYALTFA